MPNDDLPSAAVDTIHHYRGIYTDGAKCRQRVYRLPSGGVVVVFTELPDNHNASVTNTIEYLAAEYVELHPNDRPVTFVEHYPKSEGRGAFDETFDLVAFSREKPELRLFGGVMRASLGEPRWEHLTREAFLALIGRES